MLETEDYADLTLVVPLTALPTWILLLLPLELHCPLSLEEYISYRKGFPNPLSQKLL